MTNKEVRQLLAENLRYHRKEKSSIPKEQRIAPWESYEYRHATWQYAYHAGAITAIRNLTLSLKHLGY